MSPDPNLTSLQIYSWCVLGILISILLPILRGLLPKPPGVQGVRSTLSTFWTYAKPYVVVGMFSLLTGFLIVAFTWGTLHDWRAALLAGYAWDSTLQKIAKP